MYQVKTLLTLSGLLVLLLGGSATTSADGIVTRYGDLAIAGPKHNVLSFDGRSVIAGTGPLSVSSRFRLASKEILLIRASSGPSNGATYYFVTVTPRGAKSTPKFGFCNTAVSVFRDGTAVKIIMSGSRKGTRSKAMPNVGYTKSRRYIFENGKVSRISQINTATGVTKSS